MRTPATALVLLLMVTGGSAWAATELWADGNLVTDNGLTLRAPWAASVDQACRPLYPDLSDIDKAEIKAMHKHAVKCPGLDRQLTRVE